ncbi:ATP-dependent protease subunit [Ameyamaea chiangmaiensis NBRC 103196]|uniref:ATP-binding protein n=1 Tax=Ameyamaea chiangmaiensis TaxID=442969 RepID=A0A850P8X3_9PROT|nr:ATP-binding protein [Ameyamaea chiangmaiensis]MBS4074393.1 ATP-binding protein [Ameyamaea chiangmaiensis]NVN41065.1 ATP-binding protein [Ameyamaea chiangmaiensis]GBQ71882.1 ATP-dependent protease subunit [Ameyamaea chiangmaiensis NBRC 103196]
MDTATLPTLALPVLERIAAALERLSPPMPSLAGIDHADAFVWHPAFGRLTPVAHVAHVDLSLLQGVDYQKRQMLENTVHFARGLPANNAMLWGARGMGKSSLVKAVHAIANQVDGRTPTPGQGRVALIEIQRDDLSTLPELLALLRTSDRRFIVFCDDLSFEREDADYKALKSVLDGGISGRPENVLFYATSNRRHLMPREMIENESSTAINSSEATEEKVSLSDRFGLWIGFHNCAQATFLAMVRAYARERNLPISDENLVRQANAWSVGRGGRSGRVAWQFIEHLTAELSV